jgi:hypothetical protein
VMSPPRDRLIVIAWDSYEREAPDLPTRNLMAVVMAATGASETEVSEALRRDRLRSRAARGDY